MNEVTFKKHQLVDWQAAIWAGVSAGVVFLLFLIFFVPVFAGGNPWVVIRLLASIVLGESIVAPPATYSTVALVVGLCVHLVLSISFTMLLAYLIHRWGLLVGFVGGALFGLALYAFNFYTLTFFYPWFFAMRSWPIVVAHLIFGAIAGVIYESLEVETYVIVTEG